MLTHQGTRELATERLRLRRHTHSDAEDMFREYANDERVAKFLSWEAYDDVEGVRRFLSGNIENYAKENVYFWAIEFGGKAIGSISVISIDERNELCEIGYCIGYSYWNQGIVSEAMRAVVGFLFREVHFRRIFAKHDVENPASGKVMQKCGMCCEGKLRGHYLRRDGTVSDSLIYGILRGDWSDK